MQSASDKSRIVIRENWLRLQDQIAEVCLRVRRDPSQVRVVGVTKYVEPELAWCLYDVGCTLLGENRPQSLWAKYEYFASRRTSSPCDRPLPQWHLIGHLQRNKLRRTLPMLDCLQSLDSLRLAQAVSQAALEEEERRLPVLIEVNLTRDPEKTGLQRDDLYALIEQANSLPGLDIRGLMAMSSQNAGPQLAQLEFEQVRMLRDELQSEYRNLNLNQLSMGMSSDFPQAIACGATLVRIGSHLWQGI